MTEEKEAVSALNGEREVLQRDSDHLKVQMVQLQDRTQGAQQRYAVSRLVPCGE